MGSLSHSFQSVSWTWNRLLEICSKKKVVGATLTQVRSQSKLILFIQPITQHTHRPRGMCNLFKEELAATTHQQLPDWKHPTTWILKGSLSNIKTWRENEQLRKMKTLNFTISHRGRIWCLLACSNVSQDSIFKEFSQRGTHNINSWNCFLLPPSRPQTFINQSPF